MVMLVELLTSDDSRKNSMLTPHGDPCRLCMEGPWSLSMEREYQVEGAAREGGL
jgi:hypothetical protein